jgi:multicomponent Na+:H+ antiporter subunit E
MTDHDGAPAGAPHRPGTTWRYEVPLVLGLVVLWAMLWGSWTPLTLLTGLVLAVLVTLLLPLPPIPLSARFDPVRFVVLLAVFCGQVVVASFQVAWVAVRRRGAPRSSMVLVPLRTRSDMTFTLSVIAISLVPGSYVVEVDLARRRILLHVLDTPDEAAADAARTSALALEARVIRALGSAADLESLRTTHRTEAGR